MAYILFVFSYPCYKQLVRKQLNKRWVFWMDVSLEEEVEYLCLLSAFPPKKIMFL